VKAILFASAASAVALAQPALAQSQPDSTAPAADESAAAGNEIVVTAQRREQTLMSVPLSIQASSGEKLAQQGINDISSLQFTTPGFQPASTSGFVQIFIRGIGNSVATVDPSVATFVDDVPRIYGTAADNLNDVERVEILKGAQGGLYGRNATGGVINIITRKPTTDAVHGDFRASMGEKDSLRLSGFINVPLSDRIALSLAGERDIHDGYIRNVATSTPFTAANFPSGARFAGQTFTPQGAADFLNRPLSPQQLNNQNFVAVRGKLLMGLSDNLKVTLAGDYSDKSDTSGGGLVDTTPAFHQAALVGLFKSVGITAVLQPGFDVTPGKFGASIGLPSPINIREYGVSGTIQWNVGGFDVSSITAYRHQRTFVQLTSGQSQAIDVQANVTYPAKEFFYQELRAVSNFDGPLRLLGGATYLANHQNGLTQTFLLNSALSIGDTKIDQHVYNWSVYAQAEYDLTDRLTLSASGRYMRESNHSLFTLPVVSSARSVEQKFIPAATLSYKLDGGTIYLRYAQGFKTGGVNIAVAPVYFPTPQDGSIFGPETVNTFEAGYRQSLFDHRLQLTATAFYNDYKDLQINARGNASFPAITTAYINAKSARTYGFEGSIDFRVLPVLTVGVNGGYLNARFKDFKLTTSTVLAPFDRSGTQMPKAPKLQLSFNANLDAPVHDRFRVVGNVLVSHTSSVLYLQSALPGVIPDAVGPGYWTTNARIGLRTMDDKFGFAVIADNLFNREYFVYGNSLSVGNSLTYGNPRIIRGEATWKF
jgi:iron complex outermembrane receptor protein